MSWKIINNMKDPNSIHPKNFTNLLERFSNENYLEELKDMEFEKININFIKEFKEF